MLDNDPFPARIPHVEMEIHAVDIDTVFFNCTCTELRF
jgi:hypothetical protein